MLALKMAYRRNRRSWFTVAAILLAVAVALIATLPMPQARAAEPTAAVAQPEVFSGDWVYRSFLATPDAAKLLNPLGITTFSLSEKDGVISGTRKGQKEGETFPLTGSADYQPNAVTFHLTGSAPSGGKSYTYTYFGYLMPTWSNADEQSHIIMGTATRTDPDAPDAMGSVTYFTATQLKE